MYLAALMLLIVYFSEQQLVDCDTNSTNNGCVGGFYTTAWNYHKKVNGSAKNTLYGYTPVVSLEFIFHFKMLDKFIRS